MRRLILSGLLLTSAAHAQALPSFEGQVIYQVLPDRFYDGDPTNNAGVDRSNLRAWHGGDLKGLTEKLPYIEKLGATALWLTPIYRQQAVNSFDTAAYHGYWPENFRQVDPHFGSLATFDAFVKAAKGAGMKIVLDQVINHYGYEASAVKANPGWFNGKAQCDVSRDKDVDCPLAGLPDLRQSVPAVRAALLENSDFWRARGVDGFRYDAIKHVERPFLLDLLKKDRAAGTWTLGEWYDADTGTVAEWQKQGFDSLFLFSLQAAMRQSVMGSSGLGNVANVLARSGELARPGEVALFLDNHDVPRFAQGSLFEDEGQARTKYGLRALMTLRGVPVIYQGTEIAMRGGADPDNRRTMRFEDAWTPAEKGVYEVAQGAIRVRQASAALRAGTQTLLTVPDSLSSDLLLLTRTSGSERKLAAWHGGTARKTYSVRLNRLGLQASAQDVTRTLYSGQDAKVSVSGGFLHLSLPPKDAAVFALK
ncbi:Glycosidase [Deinococcus reticulitermitis]|uniref:Alpha-amylase n=1 Tax=Deinococcus reticulitermitis TaxID=856736 RepID=A0A1H7AUJ0_9DEIO|nr:alpha-amylase family glycosyl hydrolase [Deinococcus reticulitermitis]SEJ68616.1 Glycosidase [Deinococcus reticulitermitis]